jgi:ATP-binding cassette, subfamily B, bacterial
MALEKVLPQHQRGAAGEQMIGSWHHRPRRVVHPPIPVVSALIGVYQTYQTTLLGNRVMADLRGRLFEHLQRLDLSFFTATRTGAIQSRLANDVGGVQSVLSDTVSSILGNVVTMLAALVAMAVLSWRLTLVAVLLIPLFVLLQVRVGRVRRTLAGQTQESLSQLAPPAC